MQHLRIYFSRVLDWKACVSSLFDNFSQFHSAVIASPLTVLEQNPCGSTIGWAWQTSLTTITLMSIILTMTPCDVDLNIACSCLPSIIFTEKVSIWVCIGSVYVRQTTLAFLKHLLQCHHSLHSLSWDPFGWMCSSLLRRGSLEFFKGGRLESKREQ